MNKITKFTGKLSAALKDERGEVNLVAILLIIVVTIGLVAIFKSQITSLINSIFSTIGNEVSGI